MEVQPSFSLHDFNDQDQIKPQLKVAQCATYATEKKRHEAVVCSNQGSISIISVRKLSAGSSDLAADAWLASAFPSYSFISGSTRYSIHLSRNLPRSPMREALRLPIYMGQCAFPKASNYSHLSVP